MPEPAPAPAPAPQPWHHGADAEMVGFWQNKGYDLTDPLKFASGITEQYRAAEKHLGAPANEMLRIPKANAQSADLAAFWQRLGVPKEAKDYDLSGVKFAGADLEQGFADAMRATLLGNFVPKDKAAAIVGDVVKWLEGQETTENSARETRWNEQKANLDKSWGANKPANMLNADIGAARLGLKPEDVKAISEVIGFDRTAEMLRKIGVGTSDDTFVEGGHGRSTQTAESAAARLAELQNDPAWSKRLLAGDMQARQEFDNLVKQSIGYVPEAA